MDRRRFLQVFATIPAVAMAARAIPATLPEGPKVIRRGEEGLTAWLIDESGKARIKALSVTPRGRVSLQSFDFGEFCVVDFPVAYNEAFVATHVSVHRDGDRVMLARLDAPIPVSAGIQVRASFMAGNV